MHLIDYIQLDSDAIQLKKCQYSIKSPSNHRIQWHSREPVQTANARRVGKKQTAAVNICPNTFCLYIYILNSAARCVQAHYT